MNDDMPWSDNKKLRLRFTANQPGVNEGVVTFEITEENREKFAEKLNYLLADCINNKAEITKYNEIYDGATSEVYILEIFVVGDREAMMHIVQRYVPEIQPLCVKIEGK